MGLGIFLVNAVKAEHFFLNERSLVSSYGIWDLDEHGARKSFRECRN